MNSRQRRGVVLLVLSVLCAFAAFAGVLTVISDVESKVGPETTAYELRTDIPAYKALSGDQFREISVPERWLPKTAVSDLDDVDGMIAATNLKEGSLLQTGMAAARPELQPGQLEIAIIIDAETGVAGKINPGATVNIFATFDGDETKDGKPSSQIIVSNAQVIDVGELKAFDPDEDSSRVSGEGVPITFALSTLDAQRVAYAESFATHVRLALVAPGSDTSLKPGERTYTLDRDQ